MGYHRRIGLRTSRELGFKIICLTGTGFDLLLDENLLPDMNWTRKRIFKWELEFKGKPLGTPTRSFAGVIFSSEKHYCLSRIA